MGMFKRKMSPLARRRWRIYRTHKRGFYSGIILLALIFTSCFAELLCNQRPLIVKYENEFYYPLLKSYPETTFGGDFDTEADYSDPYIQEIFERAENWAIYAPIRFDYKDVDLNLDHPAPAPPSRRHLLGTDDRSRDVMSRLIYGFRISIFFGISLSILASILGIIIGGLQGYIGGKFDLLFQRITELWSSQNELLLLIILSSIFEPSLAMIFILLSLFGWMGPAAYVRAEFLRARGYEFVQAAIAMGGTRGRVMRVHILPNTLTPIITFFPFRVSGTIVGLTSLDFLGLGVPSPTASIGELLAQGKANLGSPWIILSVFIVMVTMIMLLNFVGEAAQRAMDPKVSV